LGNLPECDGQERLRGPNRIAKVIAGIALAMRFLHWRGVTHCDLWPMNILLDWAQHRPRCSRECVAGV
jgi:hypothetical protein